MSEITQVLEELKTLPKAFDDKLASGLVPVKEETDRVAKRVLELENKLVEFKRELQLSVSRMGKLRLQTGKFAGMDILDLKILESLIRAKYENSDSRPRILGEIYDGRKVLRSLITEPSLLEWADRAAEARTAGIPGINSNHPSMLQFRNSVAGWTRNLISLQTRALDSTTAAAGDELVPTFEAAELWLDVNLDTLILPLFQQQPMPTNPFDIPRQFGDTNWYPADENVQVTTTDPTTGKTTLTAYGLKTGVPFSDELEEDAVVALVPEIRAGLARNAAQVIDDVLLNADTRTANNINLDQTTISKTRAGYAQYLLGFDGLIKEPLLDNTAVRTDKNAAADLAMFVKVMGLVGKYWIARRPGEVVWITDPRTMAALMGIASLLSMASFGARATLSAGEIRELLAIPVIRSDQMLVASTTGYVSSTTANNTTGRVLLVNTSQWRVGFRRQITMEAAREAGKGQTTLYVSFRIAFAERTGTRSSAKHTGLIFDITGV